MLAETGGCYSRQPSAVGGDPWLDKLFKPLIVGRQVLELTLADAPGGSGALSRQQFVTATKTRLSIAATLDVL